MAEGASMVLTRRSLALACMLPTWAAGQSSVRQLKIGVEDRWPPFAYEQAGKARGLCVDIAEAALTAAGIPHRFEAMPYRRCMNLTKLGELDACMAVPKKESVQLELVLSSVPLLQVTGLIFTRKGGVHDRLLDSEADLSGRRLGVLRGVDYGEIIDGDPSISKTPTSSPEGVFELLLRDRTDFAIYEASRAKAFFRRRPELRQRLSIVGALPPQGVYMAFSRRLASVTEHRQRFDQALAALPNRPMTGDHFP